MKIDLEAAAERLLQMEDILILCHRHPDGDTIGSAHGLMYALHTLGKRAKIECSDKFGKRYGYITSEDPQMSFEEKAIVAVDIADPGLLGEKCAKYAPKIDLCIDHHPSNTLYAAETYLDAGASATALVVLRLVDKLGVKIDKKIADAVYTGIATDTGCFKFSNTSPESHIAAAHMIEAGADYILINKLMFETKTRNLLALESDAMKTLEYFCGNKIAVITITNDMMERNAVEGTELEGIGALTRSIEGVELGITLKQQKDLSYKVSMRSNSYVDVSKLCGGFGGGGHVRAAGCSLSGSAEDVKKLIVEAASKLF